MSWGLVLSGGAAYGLANAGVLDVLERENLKPDYIAGSSMGSIIGCLAALGLPTSTIREVAEPLKLTNIVELSMHPFKDGLHGGVMRQKLEEHLAPHIGDACIGDCAIPFVCIAGKVNQPVKWQKILKEGFTEHAMDCIVPHVFPEETRVLDAIMASSAIPVVFSPVEIEGKQYIDLCHFGAIPARSLREKYNPDLVIATDTNPSYEPFKPFLPATWNAFLQAGDEERNKSREACDLVIEPEPAAALFRFDKVEAFWEAGKVAAEESLEAIRSLLEA